MSSFHWCPVKVLLATIQLDFLSFHAGNVFIEGSGIPGESVGYLVEQKNLGWVMVSGMGLHTRTIRYQEQENDLCSLACSPQNSASIKQLKLKRRLLLRINNYPKHTSR